MAQIKRKNSDIQNSKNTMTQQEIEKNKRRNRHKMIGFIALLVIILGLYASRDRWLSKVSTESLMFRKTDEISGENFPLQINNNTGCQTCGFGEGFAVLSDTRFYIYSNDGKILETRQNTYSNTLMKNTQDRALIYEQGGYYFKVEGKRSTVYEKKSDGVILMAEISSKGYVVVVSMSDKYVCELSVYDSGGQEIYFRGCRERITDIAFDNESTGCTVVNVDAVGGTIVSESYYIKFDKKDKMWETEEVQTFCVDSYMLEGNDLFMFGDTFCTHYDKEGKRDFTQQYLGELVDYAYKDNKIAILTESNAQRKKQLMLIDGFDGDVRSIVVDNTVKNIYAESKAVYIMTESAIVAYNYKGEHLKTKEISDVYRQIFRTNEYIMLIGYNKIDRIKFELK